MEPSITCLIALILPSAGAASAVPRRALVRSHVRSRSESVIKLLPPSRHKLPATDAPDLMDCHGAGGTTNAQMKCLLGPGLWRAPSYSSACLNAQQIPPPPSCFQHQLPLFLWNTAVFCCCWAFHGNKKWRSSLSASSLCFCMLVRSAGNPCSGVQRLVTTCTWRGLFFNTMRTKVRCLWFVCGDEINKSATMEPRLQRVLDELLRSHPGNIFDFSHTAACIKSRMRTSGRIFGFFTQRF